MSQEEMTGIMLAEADAELSVADQIFEADTLLMMEQSQRAASGWRTVESKRKSGLGQDTLAERHRKVTKRSPSAPSAR
eukprot:7385976-Prymnesium_polylepis.2